MAFPSLSATTVSIDSFDFRDKGFGSSDLWSSGRSRGLSKPVMIGCRSMPESASFFGL